MEKRRRHVIRTERRAGFRGFLWGRRTTQTVANGHTDRLMTHIPSKRYLGGGRVDIAVPNGRTIEVTRTRLDVRSGELHDSSLRRRTLTGWRASVRGYSRDKAGYQTRVVYKSTTRV